MERENQKLNSPKPQRHARLLTALLGLVTGFFGVFDNFKAHLGNKETKPVITISSAQVILSTQAVAENRSFEVSFQVEETAGIATIEDSLVVDSSIVKNWYYIDSSQFKPSFKVSNKNISR